VDIYKSARKHGVSDEDINHVLDNALVVLEDEESKVLYLGPDHAGNLLEVVSVSRQNGTEIVIHAMPMQDRYRSLLPPSPGAPT